MKLGLKNEILNCSDFLEYYNFSFSFYIFFTINDNNFFFLYPQTLREGLSAKSFSFFNLDFVILVRSLFTFLTKLASHLHDSFFILSLDYIKVSYLTTNLFIYNNWIVTIIIVKIYFILLNT